MRLGIVLALAVYAVPALAAEHWHRGVIGGQDLYADDGTVVATVRHKDHSDKWIANVGKSKGSEEWVKLGEYPTMRDAKEAAQTHTGVSE